MNDDMLKAAKVAAGVETGPRSTGYINPRHRPDNEPEVAEDTDTPRRNTTSDRPVPTEPRYTPSDPTDFSHLRAGEEPVDNSQDIRALADRVWQKLHG